MAQQFQGSGEMESGDVGILGVATRDLGRLKAVLTIICRHGFGSIFQRSPLARTLFSTFGLSVGKEPTEQATPAERLSALLAELGPTFIKFGQILSMRPDILPVTITDALAELQDHAPRLTFQQVEEAISRGLGRPIAKVFAEFNPEPLATASIGQVHRATTHDGAQVVVKVQRPGIEKVMRGDLDLLYILAKVLESGLEEMELIRPAEVVSELEKALLSELDFRQELSNVVTMTSFLDPDRSVVAPQVYAQTSCRTVLTMEYFAGRSLRRLTPDSPEAQHAVSEIIHVFIKQVMFDGVFHGDPHSGNFLVNDQGQVCMIDFGLVGRLSDSQQADIVSLVFAVFARDAAMAAHVLLRLGRPTDRVNIAEFKDDIEQLLTAYWAAAKAGDAASAEAASKIKDATDIFSSVAQRHKIKLPAEYAVLMKASSSVAGLVRNLSPNIDFPAIARPYVQRLMANRLAPKAVLSELLSGATALGNVLRHLPTYLEQVMHDVQSGNVKVRAVTPQLDDLVPLIHQQCSRLGIALFAATMTMASVMLLCFTPPDRDHTLLLDVMTGAGIWAWLSLWGSHVFSRPRPFKAQKVTQFFKR